MTKRQLSKTTFACNNLLKSILLIMKKSLLFLALLFSLSWSFTVRGQAIPGDSIVYGPMFSPVYDNSVRVWVLTKNGTGTGNTLSLSLTGANATPLAGTVYNSDDRLGYSLRSFKYTNLQPNVTYTAKVLVNGVPSARVSTIKNGQNTIDDFEFLSGGCGRIYDLTRCIDLPESVTHTNGDPQMYNVMANEGSDMMVWLGDATYLLGLQHAMGQCPDGVDDWANKDMAFDRYMFYRKFHDNLTKAMPQLAIPDNHDLGPNEFDKNMPTIAQMREIFMDWWPNPEYKRTPEGQGLFSSYKYKDVEYFLTDNRSFRDGTADHFGAEQLDWLKQGLLNSTATFKVIINGTPTFTPYGGRNFSVSHQAPEFLKFIQDNNINGVLSLSADIHEQRFMVRDGDTKYPLYDLLSGNLNSDIGSGNYTVDYNNSSILNGVKQTYLRINVFGEENDRRMKVEYVGLNGQPYFQEIIHEDMLTSQDADAKKLDMNMNNSLADASSFHNTAQSSNVAYDVDRNNVPNGALKLTTATEIQISNHTSLHLHDRPYTLAFWVNPETIAANGSTIFSNAVAGKGVSFGIDGNGKLTYKDYATGITQTSQYSLLPNSWSHVVWKYDNVRRKLSLYYNGFLIQSWSNVVSPIESTGYVKIGNNFEGKKFAGLLDALTLHGRLVSDQTIANEADFETNRGEVLKVSGGQQLTIPASIVNDVFSDNFSIEFWGKLNADPGTNYTIFGSHGRINNNTTGFSFEYPDSNKLNVVLGNNTSSWNTALSNQGDAWNVGEWNHVAVTATKNGTIKYYVNGILVAQAPFSQYITNNFGLGLGNSPNYGAGLIAAELDDVRLWEKALTEAEIKQHMHYPLIGNEQDLAVYYDFSPNANGTGFVSKGRFQHEITLNNGGVLAGASSPVGDIAPEFQSIVKGKWSKNNAVNVAGLTMPEAITAYTSNVVIGKSADATMANVPNNNSLFYLKGGWRIDPVNNPFATLKINLQESFTQTQFDSITSTAREYFLLKKESDTQFSSVADGNFDGQSATFYNANLQDGIYFLAWSEASIEAGRGGSLSLAGGHDVKIPRATINPVLSSGFTVEFWTNIIEASGENPKLISNNGRVNNNTKGFAIEIPANRSITATFGTDGSGWNAINSGTPLRIGEWNHIALTVAPNQTIKLYVNGELKASNPFTTFAINDVWDLSLGKSINYGAESKTLMDEFRVWNKVKTQEEIKAEMHSIITTANENLVFNYTFNQENNGTLVNSGTLANTIPYQNATIIPATTPVNGVNLDFPDKVAGNWSVKNETDNGLYVKNPITGFTQNVVISRKLNNERRLLGTSRDTSYVAGGWHLNALNLETATVQIDLEKVFGTETDGINATVQNYLLLKGDPTGNYQLVATGNAVNRKVDFENLSLTLGNYYLAYRTDENAAIALQGGALDLANGHSVEIPKEGVNAALAGPFTIELWARLTQPAGSNTKLVGFSSYGGGTFRGWEMEFLGNQTLQTITGKGSNDAGWNSLSSSYVWKLNEWNHTAVTFTPNGEFKFYINGELVSSSQAQAFIPNTYNLALGKNLANNAPTQNNIDEFRIWSKAKSIEEIRADMYLTITDATPNLVYNYTFNQDNNGFLLNSGSQNVEVPYTNANIIPATTPVRAMEASYRNNVAGNWSVKNDAKNGVSLQNAITNFNSNLVVGRQSGQEILQALASTANDTLYLNSRFMLDPRFLERGSLKVDLSKIFTNLNDVRLLASQYFLLKGNPAQDVEILATGTKSNNIVTFAEMELDSMPVYLAWKNVATYPEGTFPIALQSLWKYNDTGVDLGTDWKTNAYNDTTWAFGNAILGYGDNRESTTLNYGGNAQNKRPTYYLRHTFNVADASQYGNLRFNIMKDDGVVVYVNGVEAFRRNMPEGQVNYGTFASTAIDGSNETAFELIETANLLQNGSNVIAVELHQVNATSSDTGFEMEVTAGLPPIPTTNYPLAQESQWYYLDNGSNLDANPWNETGHVNENWSRGFGPFGYGDPVATTVSYGPNSSSKYITTYFYKDIQVDLNTVSDLVEFGVKRDDGAVVYVNGVEVLRENMPAGEITYTTNSATIVDGLNENRYFTQDVPKTAFQNGINRIAVEVHNRDASSSDLKFDMYVKNKPAVIPITCDEPHISCFTSIMPTGQTNKMIIPQEHRFQLIFKQGIAYTNGAGNVPGNHDYTAYVPISGSSTLGHLSVNHENNPGGVSMIDLHLDTTQNLWNVDASKPVDFYNNNLVTTNRNCSGGTTPWGTVVTSEEATDAGDVNGDGYQDVGWLVEIDPATGLVKEYGNGKQEKLWAMGRMNHENVVVASDRKTAYYGEDGGTHCVYKFVADTPGNLYSGKVYVLKLDLPMSSDEPSSSTAKWILVPNATQSDRNNLNTVASALGGTNFNGVEDCEISPLDGKIYFTSKGKNRIYRFKDDGTGVSEFETFAGGVSYPIQTANGVVNEPWADGNDNLVFDNKGNLWVCQDGGLMYIWVIDPNHTQNNPKVKIFASMPAGSEPTGLTFTPDYKYGFFSVQHPNGNNAAQLDATFNNVTFNGSATVVFSLDENLGIQAPLANFVADEVRVNEGETVTFTDLSTNTPSGWEWTFEGGTPATSTQASPTVTYNTAGVYDVSLVATNVAGRSATATKAEYILVEEALGVNNPNGLGDKVSVYPNPTTGLVTVELNEEAGKKVSIKVYDFVGREISQLTNQTTGPDQKIVLNLSQIVSDQVFFIKIQVDGKSGTFKMLKVK